MRSENYGENYVGQLGHATLRISPRKRLSLPSFFGCHSSYAVDTNLFITLHSPTYSTELRGYSLANSLNSSAEIRARGRLVMRNESD